MTTDDRFDARAVLVAVDAPPDPRDARVLDVRPGTVATFDGDRYRSNLAFVYDGRRRRSYRRDELPDALAAATAYVRDGGAVRLGNRATIRDHWPTGTIRRIEQRLADTARETDGALLTWTDGPLDLDDETTYDLVLQQDG